MGMLIFGILLVSSLGGLAQILPTLAQSSLSEPLEGVKPHPPLELAGREVYVRESCSLCHTQQVRPLLAEVKRHGAAVAGGGVCLRPSVFVGVQAHRAGPAPGGRKIFGRVASDSSVESAGGCAGLHHAGVSVADDGESGRGGN